MKKGDTLKLIGVVVLAILLVNLVLFALRIISTVLFWVIIFLGAVFVYQLLPKMKK